MNIQTIQNKLKTADRQELEDLCLNLIKDKSEIEKDLQTTGRCMVSLMQTLGAMDEDLNVKQDISSIAKGAISSITMLSLRPSLAATKFSFLEDAIPLLDKYKDIIKK